MKIKTISTPLRSTLKTKIYVINICTYIFEKKACRSKWFSHNNNIFVCARDTYIASPALYRAFYFKAIHIVF